MDNTSLFKFVFVDREEQKRLINDFLSNRTESNVLWLSGSHGVGKSFLLNNINSFARCPKTVYIELKSENSEQNCLLELLRELGNITALKTYWSLYYGIRSMTGYDFLRKAEISCTIPKP